jgi:dimeric dUTPase (all-alpha-NTP-PPase superfamily)
MGRAQPAKPEQLLAAFARMKDVLARRKKDRSYSTEYKRYCRFVEANGLRSADDGESNYIHRNAVDAFFL